jgi:hypothetical protein
MPSAVFPRSVVHGVGVCGQRSSGREGRKEAQSRPARAPYVLTLSSQRIVRGTLPEAVVPYLQMSGRWLEEHGFAIGSGVQVLVEHGCVTLISGAAKRDDEAASGGPAGPAAEAMLEESVLHTLQVSRRG